MLMRSKKWLVLKKDNDLIINTSYLSFHLDYKRCSYPGPILPLIPAVPNSRRLKLFKFLIIWSKDVQLNIFFSFCCFVATSVGEQALFSPAPAPLKKARFLGAVFIYFFYRLRLPLKRPGSLLLTAVLREFLPALAPSKKVRLQLHGAVFINFFYRLSNTGCNLIKSSLIIQTT